MLNYPQMLQIHMKAPNNITAFRQRRGEQKEGGGFVSYFLAWKINKEGCRQQCTGIKLAPHRTKSTQLMEEEEKVK